MRSGLRSAALLVARRKEEKHSIITWGPKCQYCVKLKNYQSRRKLRNQFFIVSGSPLISECCPIQPPLELISNINVMIHLVQIGCLRVMCWRCALQQWDAEWHYCFLQHLFSLFFPAPPGCEDVMHTSLKKGVTKWKKHVFIYGVILHTYLALACLLSLLSACFFPVWHLMAEA